MLARTPRPPYYAVIFSSLRSSGDDEGYGEAAARMLTLAADQPGYLGVESAREGIGITVSYWRSLEDIAAWRAHAEHTAVRHKGRAQWYERFELRVARVERASSFDAAATAGGQGHEEE